MIVAEQSTDMAGLKLVSIADYESIVGASTVDRILSKARDLRDLHIVNVSSTYYGGGVADLLSSMTSLDERRWDPDRLARHPGAPRFLQHHEENA